MEYAIFALVLLSFVAAFCAVVPSQIRNVLVAGALVAPLGPASELWFLADYWKRPTLLGTRISIEDVLFGFAIGALSICLPYIILRIGIDLRFEKLRAKRVLGACITILVCMLLGTTVGRINSIITCTLAFWLITAYAIFWLKVPYWLCSVGACVSAAYLFLGYFILERIFPGVVSAWCFSCNPSGIKIGFLNLEEFVWDFSWGAVASTIPIILFRGAVHGKSTARPITAGLQED